MSRPHARYGQDCVLAALGSLAALAGCADMSGLGGESRYACAAPDGVICESVSGIYANAVRNNLPGQRPADAGRRPSSPTQRAEPAVAPLRPLAPSAADTAAGGGGTAAGTQTLPPLRTQERYLRLWIKPWEDIDGDLFDQLHVYVQVDSGRWQIDHLRQRLRERYAAVRPPEVAAASPPRDDTEDRSSTDPEASPSAPALRPAAQDVPRPLPSMRLPPDRLQPRRQ